MKKKLSIVLCFVLAIVGIFTNNIKANAALPNSISGISATKTLNYNGYDQMLYKTYGGGIVLCSSFHVQGVGPSCTLSSSQWSMPTQAGVAAIVIKYNSSPSERNYYDAELALNEFLYYYETKSSTNRISSTRDVRNTSGVKAFYDNAVNAYNEAKSNFAIKLTAEGNKLTFKLDGDNYISNKVTVSGTDKYDISLSGIDGAEVYNKKDNSFYIKVPSSKVEEGSAVTVKLTVKGSKTIVITKKYSCGSGNQDVVVNKTDNTTVTDSKYLSGSITKEKKTTKLKISKQDITTKEELPGATLVLKDSLGNEIDKWVSGEEPHYVEGLEPGKYFLTEIVAPTGYKLSEDTVEFTLEADNTVKEVVMYNTHESKYQVKISKQDITTKQELPGATLVLKDNLGNEIARWVSGTEPYYLELAKGEYILTEIQAPNGYDLSYEVIKFTVGDNGEVETSVVMYNSKTPDTSDRNIIVIILFVIISSAGVGLSIYRLKHQK